MNQDQRRVAIGALSGVTTMAALTIFGSDLLPQPSDTSLAGRLAYAVTWSAFASLPLIAMVAAVGNARFFSEAIDPTRGKESDSMRINANVANNTMEQYVLFVVFSAAFAAVAGPDHVRICGSAAIAFLLMRTAFWIGYRIRPVYRAFGFAGTFYLNIGLLISTLYFALSGG